MGALFVSHCSRDRAVTAKVCSHLRKAGFVALFVDYDPDDGIPAGREWERELYSSLRRTDALVFLASEVSVASRWCFAELSLARSLGHPVFPLRLAPGVGLPLLNDVQWIDLGTTDLRSGVDRLVAGLRAAGLDPADSFAWDAARLPFPGLASFTADDAAVFFGREHETQRLVDLLHPTLQHGPGRFVAILGPSGSGKSSLLHAGLLPRLARPPGRWVLLPSLLPGRHPVRNLAACLARAFATRGLPRPVPELAELLGRGPSVLVELAEELAEIDSDDHRPSDVLMVIDQAEELVTRSGAREQESFLALLRGALSATGSIWAVATMRSEFLTSRPERAGLAEAIDDTLIIEPLGRSRLAEVIARPAKRAGLELAPGLVERLVEDTAGGDALPLLAYTLRELCQRAHPHGRITIEDYTAIGGVVGALQHRADRLTNELTRRGYGGRVVPTLAQLAAVTGDDEPTRRGVRRSELTTDELMIVDAFVDARLLTSTRADADPAEEGISGELASAGEPAVEVAHEALLRQWPPLRRAIEADRAGLRLRADLERLAADWQHSRRDESYLLHGSRLAALDEWANQRPNSVGPIEREYLQASRSRAAREHARLHEEQRAAEEAKHLQYGLFPAPLLAGSRVRIRAFYRSGRSRAYLGGDFYDVVVNPSGIVHAIIGTVSGNGPAEAALGALLRVSWRTLVLAGVDEAELLPKLQLVLVSERHDRTSSTTACTVTIDDTCDLGTRTALVRLAGHPPPIVLADAPHSVARQTGPPLGTVADARWDVQTVALEPTWALLLYTPGLIGGQGPVADTRLGTEGLIELVEDERRTDLDRLPQRLVERAHQLNGGPLVEDVVALLISPCPPSTETAPDQHPTTSQLA
ncbi:nSTAND1 domain-containing NTPase [Pseudonocardia humida]|uniref:SpoIIE family protein phosphatase n=1 Tax=Pseudonocardia humida TaxID=2800819 RepID=A0ABT1A894_9PSEU|nr:SpoIIE family protein phosphatase [Pseudonocardia humida]MCO1659186.1 SpoIIE family protein phosphatase [Pseudonocardia humida]